MEKARIRPIEGYPGYLVSDRGDVFSLWRRRAAKRELAGSAHRLSPGVTSTGYLQVQLFADSKKKKIKLVHRLVLEAFVGPCPIGMEAAHLNGIRSDCRVENLLWCTRKENHSHKIRHGTAQRGSNHPGAKLRDCEVAEIKRLVASGCKAVDVARRFSALQTTISNIKHGRSWTHVAMA